MRGRVWLIAAVAFVGGFVLTGAGSAFAGEAGPQWSVSAVSRPTYLAPGGGAGENSFVVLVTNTGGVASSGVVTVTDELPRGLTAGAGVSAVDELGAHSKAAGSDFSKDCEFDGEEENGVTKESCSYSGVVQPDDTLVLKFPVVVSATPPDSCVAGEVVVPAGAAGCVTNVVRVSGGGGVSASMRTATVISAGHAGFGISPGGASTALSSAQAGAHPDLTVSTAFDTEKSEGATAGNLKNFTYDLPAGFAGDLVSTPTCQADLFLREECPVPTQVGVTTVILDQDNETKVELEPVYDLAPEPGEVGKLGFNIGQFYYEGDISVRAPGEAGPAGEGGEPYGLKTVFYNNTAGLVDVDNASLTVWGVPASPVHDALRWQPGGGGFQEGHFGVADKAAEAPFFTNPTACGSELHASSSVTSWQGESPEATTTAFGSIVGCDELGMEPSLTAETTSDSAYAPTGFDLATRIPQTYESAGELATSTLKKEVVTLPEAMTLNPSAGAGLQACSEAQYGEEGTQYAAGHGCPNASKLATVKIKTPSIEEEVTGSVFLAEPAPRGAQEPGRNPFNSLVAMYLIARAPGRGVLVKAPGEVQLNPVTGQIVTTFDDLPPLPFSEATFAFNQGANAPLVTPPACGDYTVTAQLTPWSDPEGAALALLAPAFPIDTSCPAGGVPPFAPTVSAGTLNNSAGSYSTLDMRISRNDGEQEITGFATQLPPGLTANLVGVPFCSEAQIQAAREKTGAEEQAQPACPAASEIGQTIAEAGVGQLLAQAPGKLYMAGPFEGAPFSVVSITSADVGPFDLGTVVVHLPLDINPETAAVSIPAGPADQIPHIIKGVVVHLRQIHVYVERPNYIINPTSCNAMSLSATVIGSGASFSDPADEDPVTVTDPFQAAGCASLAFKPTFKVSTSAKASKADGASLNVKLTYPSGSMGTQANVKSVKVELPKALPSQLKTLQKACTAKQFESNPAGCPSESVIGHAIVHTQLLPVPLEGPAYFVSHGGEAFPNLILVLQGYGVTVQLVGDTDIKNGITSSTFASTPDVPFETFELTLPQGKYSALAANGNLCQQKLVMPTAFVAQNGATLNQETHIEVSGCSKTLSVVSKKVHKRTLRLSVYAPGAGRVTVSGKGIGKGAKSTSGNEAVSFTFHGSRAGKVKLKVSFTPKTGKRQSKTLTVRFGK
jgi:hypothetical protein